MSKQSRSKSSCHNEKYTFPPFPLPCSLTTPFNFRTYRTHVLQEQYNQVYDLARLISKSDMYSNQIDIYDKAMIEIEKLTNKAKQLKNLYIKVIREGLIGVKVANYNPNNIQNNQISHQSQYNKLRQEYKYMKNTATAYGELMRQYNK